MLASMLANIQYIFKELVTKKCHANQVGHIEWILPLHNATIQAFEKNLHNVKQTYSLLRDK